MAENSLGVKTDEIYERRNEKGKEMQNYQDAEKQLLAIQAAQQQNLNAARTSNLAQYQNNQNLASAGDVLNQTQQQQANTQQVSVNPATQQILQKYGATKPGTITKTTHSQQVTKQNITINNNTTTTTNNQVSTPPPQPQVVRPQRDNSSEKFKIWLNNTLARQQEDYARREKDYDKRESALTRDSNKMLRKLGEFSKDMMEKMDPRKIGSTATSQIKTLLFMFGFQYLASNWTKILKTVASIESGFKRGLAYFGLYNLKSNGSGSFCFKPGESQFALDIYGLFSGNWKVSRLMPSGGSGNNSGISPLMGGENGFVGGLRKVLLGDQAVGGKDKGLIEIMKEFFVNQGKKRMAAAKMIEKPDFNVGDIGGTLKNIGDYFGQLLSVFLGDPEEAIRSNIVSRMSINSAHQSWNKIKNLSTGDTKNIYTTTDNKTHSVEQGIMAYTRGKQRGLSLRSIDSSGNLISGDAESTYSQSDDLALALEDAQEGDELDAGRLATGFHRLYQAALSDKRGVVPVSPEFLNKFIPKTEDRDRLLKSGDMKYTKYNYVIRKVKATDDTGVSQQEHWYDSDWANSGWWHTFELGNQLKNAAKYGHQAIDWLRKESTTGKEEERLVLVPEGNERPSDLVTESSEMLYELTPNALNQIVNKYKADDQHVEIDLSNEDYFNTISDFAARESRIVEEKRNPDKFKKTYEVNYRDSQGNGTASLNYDEYQIYKNKKVYTGSDKRFAKYVNESLYNSKVKLSEDTFKDSFLQGTVNGIQKGGGLSAAAIANKTLNGLSFESIAPGLSDFGSSYTTFGTAYAGNPLNGQEQDKAVGSILSGLDNKMIAVNPANPEEKIDFAKLDLKSMTSKEATDLFNKVKNWNFNSDNDASKLVKAKDSDLKKRVINFLGEALLGKGYPGIYMANDQGYYKRYKEELSEILSDPNLFDDPSSRTKLKELLNKYALVENDPRISGIGRGRTKEEKENDFNDSVKRRVTGESHINEIFGVYDEIVSIIDAKLDATRKESLLNQLGIFIQNRQDAEAELKKVNNQITTYNNDYTQRVIAADGIDAEFTNMYKDSFSDLNQWKDDVNQNNQQFSEDVQNNEVTKKASDVLDTLSGYLDGVKETFDDYSSEAKSWFGERFNNAKEVVNDFLRNLDYTKVSLARYPENTLIDREKKLLIWHCFNNPSSNDVYDFRIHDAAGRFGAGRNNSKPWTRLHKGRTTFDRVHAGQDISDFRLNGSPLSGKVSPTLFAPFNCVVMSYRNDYEKAGKNVIIRQTGGDSEKTKYGRFGIAVCHLDSITDDVKKAYRARVNKTGERIILEKGTALGIMGGSGHGERWHYDPHFHVNVLDYDNTGPFDGPFTKPLKGVSSSFSGFHGNGFNEHAVDPLFVYVDDDGDVSNETFYLSSDRKVVTVDEANADKKQFNKNNLYDGELSTKDKEEENSEENPDNENGEEKDDRPFLEKAWEWLKDMAFKVKLEYLDPSIDSMKSSKEDFLKLKQGNTGMSFAKSSYSYSGQVTPEFVNYQNYLKNAGKIGLGPDGQPLSEAEWRNQVFDMTGSDPVALKLGEYLNHGVAVKSASQLSNKDTKETISKYSETNNTENTVNNVEGSTSNGEVNNVTITNSMEEEGNNTIVGGIDGVKFVPNAEGFFGNKTLTDLQNEGKPFYNLEKKGDLTNERLVEIRKELVKNKEFMAKITDTLLAAFDRQAGLTVAGLGNNKKPNVTVANTVTGTGSSNVN